ncbi:Alpha/beta hydrolase fold-1 [Dillenia turbinata]|uniref:Alpha/beta hydrolase fold-1 n=1 Tax=Dillenia turbinata TaxID=194707 RepID=A0AAN8W590_9MAGN
MDVLNLHEGGIVEALNARIYGNATQTLVLSHGYGTDQTVWHFLVPFLACYFRVVVYDLVFTPNVNPDLYDPKKYTKLESYADDLVSLLDELNVNKTIYVGHSMSAMIGCIAATRRPELFEHLILLSGSPRYLNTKRYFGGFERSELKTILMQINQNFSGWVQDFAPKAVGVSYKDAVTEFENSLKRMRPQIALSVAKTVFLSDLRHILPCVQVPSTIIQSKKDIIVPNPVAFYMKRRLGGHAKVEILDTEGHFPQLSVPSLLINVLRKILDI